MGLISLDYAKAFNRMSHQQCLNAFARKGASSNTIGLVAAFLKGRKMCIRYNGKTSSTRDIPGGSPQGCVSANFLFCITIEGLEHDPSNANESECALDQGILEHDAMERTRNCSDSFLSSDEEMTDPMPFHKNGIETTLRRMSPEPCQDPVGTMIVRGPVLSTRGGLSPPESLLAGASHSTPQKTCLLYTSPSPRD